MAKWLLIIHSNCNDPLREEAFNEWYSNVHIPDVLTNPGFTNAARYKQVFVPNTGYEKSNPNVLESKYLATYEIETGDINMVIRTMLERAKSRDKSRSTDRFNLVIRGVYQEIN